MYKCTKCGKRGMSYIWKKAIERAMFSSKLECRYCKHKDSELNVIFKK